MKLEKELLDKKRMEEQEAEAILRPRRQNSMANMHLDLPEDDLDDEDDDVISREFHDVRHDDNSFDTDYFDLDNSSSNGTMFSCTTRLTTDDGLNREYPILRRSPLCYGPKMSEFISGSLADAKSKCLQFETESNYRY